MSRKRRERSEQRKAEQSRTARGGFARSDLLWALGLTLLAWAHRLGFLRSNRDFKWPFTIFYEGDSETFFRYGRALLAGKLYDGGIPFHPPGFPWLTAALHALVGAGEPQDAVPFVAVKAILALIGSLSVGLLYLLVKPYLGKTVALVSALLATYHFGLYVLHVAPVTEGTYQTLLFLCLLLWTRRFEHPLAAPVQHRAGKAGALGLGLLLGFLALVRAEAVLVAILIVAVGIVGWLRGKPRTWASLRPWALVAAGWVLAVTPWTVRNAYRLAEVNELMAAQMAEPLPVFVPLTIYGPVNLALANNDQADGTFSREALTSGAESAQLALADSQHLRFILHGDEMAARWAWENPGAALRLLGRKWALFFSAWKLGWTQWDLPGGLSGVRRPVDVFVPDSGLAVWLGAPLAFLGLVLCLGTPGAPRRWAFVVLLATSVGLIATGLFFGYVRQGLLVLPLWLTLTVAAGAAVVRRLRHRGEGWRLLPSEESEPSRRLLKVLGGIVLALFVLELWGAGADRNYKATGTTLEGTDKLNRDEPVRLELSPPER